MFSSAWASLSCYSIVVNSVFDFDILWSSVWQRRIVQGTPSFRLYTVITVIWRGKARLQMWEKQEIVNNIFIRQERNETRDFFFCFSFSSLRRIVQKGKWVYSLSDILTDCLFYNVFIVYYLFEFFWENFPSSLESTAASADSSFQKRNCKFVKFNIPIGYLGKIKRKKKMWVQL